MKPLLARVRAVLADHRRTMVLVVCWIAAAAVLATAMSLLR
ncbi:hypothetical protein [Cellulomonas aerilata]|nr:hypothetical protein [Cellulomonas aerilata]